MYEADETLSSNPLHFDPSWEKRGEEGGKTHVDKYFATGDENL